MNKKSPFLVNDTQIPYCYLLFVIWQLIRPYVWACTSRRIA